METKMDEIQTRANEWAEKRTMPKSQLAHAVICYMNGALDQREIDIQRTCEWLYDNLDWGFMETNNFISKFKQAMKGK